MSAILEMQPELREIYAAAGDEEQEDDREDEFNAANDDNDNTNHQQDQNDPQMQSQQASYSTLVQMQSSNAIQQQQQIICQQQPNQDQFQYPQRIQMADMNQVVDSQHQYHQNQSHPQLHLHHQQDSYSSSAGFYANSTCDESPMISYSYHHHNPHPHKQQYARAEQLWVHESQRDQNQDQMQHQHQQSYHNQISTANHQQLHSSSTSNQPQHHNQNFDLMFSGSQSSRTATPIQTDDCHHISYERNKPCWQSMSLVEHHPTGNGNNNNNNPNDPMGQLHDNGAYAHSYSSSSSAASNHTLENGLPYSSSDQPAMGQQQQQSLSNMSYEASPMSQSCCYATSISSTTTNNQLTSAADHHEAHLTSEQTAGLLEHQTVRQENIDCSGYLLTAVNDVERPQEVHSMSQQQHHQQHQPQHLTLMISDDYYANQVSTTTAPAGEEEEEEIGAAVDSQHLVVRRLATTQAPAAGLHQSVKGRRGRPRKKGLRSKSKVNGKLWEFIRDLLLNERTNPSFIRWERREDGVFKFVQSDKVAKMWGERKQNPKMTYEKLSRAMRYYYKSKVLLPVFGRRLVYKFGPNATGWQPAKIVDL